MGTAKFVKNTLLLSLMVSSVLILCITYRQRLDKNINRFWNEGDLKGLWFIIKVILRYLLFTLCLMSYFWDDSNGEQHVTHTKSPINKSKDELEANDNKSQSRKSIVFRYTESALNNFLQVSFTAFWPRSSGSHSVIKFATIINVILLPIFNILLTYSRVKRKGEWTLFTFMKIGRKVVQLGLFMYGVNLGRIYFSRPEIYPQDVKFAKMPWKKFRNKDSVSSTSQKHSKTLIKSGTMLILIGLIFACVFEAYLMEYQHLNRREGARIIEADRSNYLQIFYKFITGSWTNTMFPLFVYPEIIAICIGLCFVSFGRKLLKGLLTYCLLISGHVTVVTILSLVIVWEIERFDTDLRYNLIQTFEKTDNIKSSAKKRLYIFDQIKIKRDELIPSLSILFHYLVIDRLLFIIFDFYNFTCDKTIDFNVYAFIARHLFQLVLTMWVVWKMARFNVKWPNQLIDTVHRWRLQSWIQSIDDKDDNTDTKDKSSASYYQSTRYFLDREYELWKDYLSQDRFVKRFGFRIFGYRVDIRWFTLSFGFQLAFIFIGMTKTYASVDTIIC